MMLTRGWNGSRRSTLGSSGHLAGKKKNHMGHLIESLPPEERITHYRAMACEVQYLANEAQFDEVRTQFLKLAESWTSVADKMERHLIEGERVPTAVSRDWLRVA
jgi:hypothetical protein